MRLKIPHVRVRIVDNRHEDQHEAFGVVFFISLPLTLTPYPFFPWQASRAPTSITDKADALATDALEDRQLDLVLVDANVLLKIAKHARDSSPESVTGQLLGIDGKTDVEISNCFPFPNADSNAFDDDEDADAG